MRKGSFTGLTSFLLVQMHTASQGVNTDVEVYGPISPYRFILFKAVAFLYLW